MGFGSMMKGALKGAGGMLSGMAKKPAGGPPTIAGPGMKGPAMNFGGGGRMGKRKAMSSVRTLSGKR
jgi:hypothetical protein